MAGKEDLVLPLPPAWVSAAREKRAQVQAVRATIRDASLSPAQSALLKQCVEGAFKQWLVTSGNVRQVADLARMQAHSQGEGSTAMRSPGGTQRVVMGVMSPSAPQHAFAPAAKSVE
jgi:phosphoserine phosphatase